MKKIYISLIAISISAIALSQNFTDPLTVETNDDAVLSFNNTDNSWQYLQFKRSGIRKTWMGLSNGNNFRINKEGGGNILLTGGNVGIGTTSPMEKLDVNDGSIIGFNSSDAFLKIKRKQGQASIKGLFDNTTGYDGHIIIDAGRTSDAVFLNHYISSDVYLVNGGGKVGIGTSLPSDKLHVDNGSIFGHSSSDAFLKIKRKQGQASIKGVFDNTAGYDGHVIIEAGRSSDAVYLNNYISSNAYLVNGGGNVGIGTTDLGSHRLAVEGSIGAREIKVEASGWSDFVFEKDYNLRTLEEVEQHIDENGHLPEIPSEAEVTENGINLGEMNAKLLQKIEELTLYLIDQNKQLQNANQNIAELRKEVSALKKE